MVMISADVQESHFLFQPCVQRTSKAITYSVSIKHNLKSTQSSADTAQASALAHALQPVLWIIIVI